MAREGKLRREEEVDDDEPENGEGRTDMADGGDMLVQMDKLVLGIELLLLLLYASRERGVDFLRNGEQRLRCRTSMRARERIASGGKRRIRCLVR